MREIEKTFRGKWGDYVANLIKEDNRVIISYRIDDYLRNKKTRSATYSEIQKDLKIPQSTLNEILKDTTEIGWLIKKQNEETKQFEYYLPYVGDPTEPDQNLEFVQQARNPIWFYVYENPKLTPKQKTEIALKYILNLLDKYGRQTQLKTINKLLRGIEPKTDFKLQDTEVAIKINFALAKKYGFADELYKQLIDNILLYDPQQAVNVIKNTKDKLKKYKLPTSTS